MPKPSPTPVHEITVKRSDGRVVEISGTAEQVAAALNSALGVSGVTRTAPLQVLPRGTMMPEVGGYAVPAGWADPMAQPLIPLPPNRPVTIDQINRPRSGALAQALGQLPSQQGPLPGEPGYKR